MYVGQWYGFSQVRVRWRYALLSCVTPLMYFELTEASETNRLATEFLKLWSFISLSMKCASVFLTANVGRLFIENVYVLTCLIAFMTALAWIRR